MHDLTSAAYFMEEHLYAMLVSLSLRSFLATSCRGTVPTNKIAAGRNTTHQRAELAHMQTNGNTDRSPTCLLRLTSGCGNEDEGWAGRMVGEGSGLATGWRQAGEGEGEQDDTTWGNKTKQLIVLPHRNDPIAGDGERARNPRNTQRKKTHTRTNPIENHPRAEYSILSNAEGIQSVFPPGGREAGL